MDSLKDAWENLTADCCKQDATVKKVIAVVGATGQQGGGLVNAILDDPKGGFSVRALTRDPTKAKSFALKKAGAQVVKFDMDDASTHGPALEGAYGVFAVTNYWEHMSVETEKAQAKAIADAAKVAGVKHIIWSTLEGTTAFFDSLSEEERPNKLEDGYYVPHFDGKHECNAYFPPSITTNLYTSFYLDNFESFGMVKDGIMCVNMADKPLPVIASEDIGKCAYGIFKAGDKYVGKSVFVAGDVLTCSDLMHRASDATGQDFEYKPVSRETYAAFDFPGANDLANMFYFKVMNEDFAKKRNPRKALTLNPDLQSAQVWMENNASAVRKLSKPVPEQPAGAPPSNIVGKSAPAHHTSSSMEVNDNEGTLPAASNDDAANEAGELWA